MHNDTTGGCYLEEPVKGGSMQQLDSVQGNWHRDLVTHCHPGLNLKVGKMTYRRLGNLDPNWAIFPKSGQNFSRSGQKNIFIWKDEIQQSP